MYSDTQKRSRFVSFLLNSSTFSCILFTFFYNSIFHCFCARRSPSRLISTGISEGSEHVPVQAVSHFIFLTVAHFSWWLIPLLYWYLKLGRKLISFLFWYLILLVGSFSFHFEPTKLPVRAGFPPYWKLRKACIPQFNQFFA